MIPSLSLALLPGLRTVRRCGALALLAASLLAATGCRKEAPTAPTSAFLPVVADAGGGAGRVWKTSLLLDGSGLGSPVDVELTYWDRSGTAHRAGLAIVAGGGRRIDDLFELLRTTARPAVGAPPQVGTLELKSTGGPLPSLRVEIHSVDPSTGGRVGQVYTASDLHLSTEGHDGTLSAWGLPTAPEFRSNLGVANPGEKDVTVEIRLADLETGAEVGNRTTLTVAPHRLEILPDVVHALHAPADSRAVSARIRPTGGTGAVVAYASVVDARTEGPVFLPATPLR